MIGSDLLDAAIGVIFVILTFSLIASALQEAIASLLNLRGRLLRRGIFRIVEGARDTDILDVPWLTAARLRRADLAMDVLTDPAIRILHGPRGLFARLWDKIIGWRRTEAERALAALGRLPDAIPPESFANAVVQSLLKRIDLSRIDHAEGLSSANVAAAGAALRTLVEDLSAEADRALDVVRGLVASLQMGPADQDRLTRVLKDLSVARAVEQRLAQIDTRTTGLEEEVERLLFAAETRMKEEAREIGRWFDQSMDRLSDWYASRTRIALFVIGAALAMAINLDLSVFATRLVTNDALRAEVLERATVRTREPIETGSGSASEDPVERAAEALRRAETELSALPGYGGAGLGRRCGGAESWISCTWRALSFGAVLSWLLIGLGCMTGGQFWYDALGAVIRLRPVAARGRTA